MEKEEISGNGVFSRPSSLRDKREKSSGVLQWRIRPLS